MHQTIRSLAFSRGARACTIVAQHVPTARGTRHDLRWVHFVQPRRRRTPRARGAAWSASSGEAVAPPARPVDLPGSDRPGGDPGPVVLDPDRAGRLAVFRAARLARGRALAVGEPGDRALDRH